MQTIINMHGLGRPGPEVPVDERPYWLSVEQFLAIVDMVSLERERVSLTFDDGNHSDIAIALPALKQRGLKAKFFIVAQRIGKPGYLSEADIRVLRGEGMEIGSHGFDHVPWTSLSEATLTQHMGLSVDRLTCILGEPINTAAAPFGAYNRRVLGVLRRRGVREVYTSDQGPALPGWSIVARTSIRSDMSLDTVSNLIKRRYTMFDVMRAYLGHWRRTLN